MPESLEPLIENSCRRFPSVIGHNASHHVRHPAAKFSKPPQPASKSAAEPGSKFEMSRVSTGLCLK
jgi:hypothetical protein